jgi:hypothetical protein
VKSPRARRTLSTHELARFLALLAETGNFALACVSLGRARSGLYKRRIRDSFFDSECVGAIALFRSSPSLPGGGGPPKAVEGQPILTLTTYAGRPQLRRAAPGTLTRTGIETFLKTLAATANVRFAALSVGVKPSSIYARRRRDPAFAAEMDIALEVAVAALEMRVIEASGVFADDDDLNPPRNGEGDHSPEEGNGGGGPERNRVGTIGTLTASEALHFLTLHSRRNGKS